MDSTGGGGPADGEDNPSDLDRCRDHPVPTSTRHAHLPLEKETSKNSEKLLTAVNRWSQEENSAVTPGESNHIFKTPHNPLLLTNGTGREATAAVNGIHAVSSGHSDQAVGYKLTSGRHSEQSLLNNNLIEDKCNLRCVDEKSYCLYHKFPTKVNNNVYPEKGTAGKDGMDEYFQMNSSVLSSRQSSQQPQPQTKCNELSPSRDTSKYPDHLNLLNGEEEDEDDGCIYTYKGENVEANLSHLIDMCLSCGLPNTERSSDGRDAFMQSLLNGSARPNPPEQNNLFSPDMDFLEMDFDPGPNGDGDVDSDCEDNCIDECDSRLVIEHDAAFSVAGALNPISVLNRKTNNYCAEMRNLMCKRCESSICDGKIDNVALNLSMHENNSSLNFGRGPSDGLDDRPTVGNEVLNVPRNAMNVPKDLNVDLNQFGHSPCVVNGRAASLVPEDEYDPPDNDSVENNLGEVDIIDMIDDEYGEDADDEDGDDSNSDMPEFGERMALCNGSSEFVLRDDGVHVPCSASKSINKTSNKANNKSTNNNLGSVSAPEVSPAKEYSPLEKFGRSISFHNQLSSPKYENVCFSHRASKSDEYPCQVVSEREPSAAAESANLEVCAGRLSSRENSVFNILSDPNAGSSQSLNSDFGSVTNTDVGLLGKHNSVMSLPNAATTVSHASVLRTSAALASSIPSEARSPSNTVNGSNTSPCPLPIKSLRPKNTNPSQDPNTASEGEGGGEESCPRVKKVMIWTELQASGRQVTQIATSACGATAIINVLLALDYPYTIEEVQESIKTRLRAESAPVVDYLLSRSVAGTTHRDLIDGVTSLSKGSIKAKFFHMFPKRAVQLSRWLAQWINRGGVPLATLNLQVGVAVGQTIPDAWHHQMIFGVGPQGIYLTNPLECVSDCLLGDQLCTDSILLIRRADIVSRWGRGDRLIRLTQQKDTRWLDMNVLGQVLGVLKEQAAPPVVQGRRHLTSHVAIPAAYKSGITIFMSSDNPHLHTLLQAEDLPLLE
ncbi:hypothetical protein SK128_002156 [Halocaridina rubra]|uniref:Uncharacterized protein n=1 Tax=Halocaridina rubra TaxID=373956 RepID=A0AAN9AF76_HALRR